MRLLLFNLATDADDPILGFTTDWISALAKRVEFIHVITMRAGRIEVPENVLVYSVGKEKGYSEPRRAVEFYRLLFQVLREDRVDACFSHMIPIFTVLAAPVLKTKGIPIVTWYAHPSLPWVLKLAHHLSDWMVTSVESAYPYKHDKLVVIGQGIDTDLFCPDTTAFDSVPMILCVGRLSPVKDHPTLLRAAQILKEDLGRSFRVAIVGGPGSSDDDAYVKELHKLVERLRLQEVVQFHPPVPRSSLPQWYRRCTLHVNLTPTGFGDKAAWEAMSCGKPCLVANEGFRETLGLYTDRLLFRYKDPEDLARRIKAILSLPKEEQECIGSYLREQIVRLHSLQGLGQRLLSVLEEAK
jgi:glycosyltransferase involved in cell wall biosynthesis